MTNANSAERSVEPAPAVPAVVLTVDDSATVRQLIAMAMRYRPHVIVLMAGEGSEGIRLACERRPVLILLDGNLPDMSGADVLRRLKAVPATSEIPVVVLTGDTREEIHDELRAAGAAECIVKPIDLDRLYELVDRYVPKASTPASSFAARPVR